MAWVGTSPGSASDFLPSGLAVPLEAGPGLAGLFLGDGSSASLGRSGALPSWKEGAMLKKPDPVLRDFSSAPAGAAGWAASPLALAGPAGLVGGLTSGFSSPAGFGGGVAPPGFAPAPPGGASPAGGPSAVGLNFTCPPALAAR